MNHLTLIGCFIGPPGSCTNAEPLGQALSVRPDVLNEAFLHEFREFQVARCGNGAGRNIHLIV